MITKHPNIIPDKMDEQKKSYNKTNYFKVPEKYFSECESEILSKINSSTTKKVSFRRVLYTVSSAAAIISIVFFTWKFSDTKRTYTTTEMQLSTLDKKIIEEYLLEHLNENEIVQICAEHQIEVEPSSFMPNSVNLNHAHSTAKEIKNIDTSISSKDIIEYFNDENIEIETL